MALEKILDHRLNCYRLLRKTINLHLKNIFWFTFLVPKPNITRKTEKSSILVAWTRERGSISMIVTFDQINYELFPLSGCLTIFVLMSACLCVAPSVGMSISWPVSWSVLCISLCLSVKWFAYLSERLSICLFVCLLVCKSADSYTNQSIDRFHLSKICLHQKLLSPVEIENYNWKTCC